MIAWIPGSASLLPYNDGDNVLMYMHQDNDQPLHVGTINVREFRVKKSTSFKPGKNTRKTGETRCYIGYETKYFHCDVDACCMYPEEVPTFWVLVEDFVRDFKDLEREGADS